MLQCGLQQFDLALGFHYRNTTSNLDNAVAYISTVHDIFDVVAKVVYSIGVRGRLGDGPRRVKAMGAFGLRITQKSAVEIQVDTSGNHMCGYSQSPIVPE